MNENTTRAAGVLCHISSLPNEYGIGSLGKEAYAFVDILSKCKVKYWQILPLVQTGYGDSPYQSVCCNSGNPYFIDLEALYAEGLLTEEELSWAKEGEGNIDYANLYNKRYTTLKQAYSRFNLQNQDFLSFIESGDFEDYSLFMSLKSRYGGSFNNFPQAYKYKESFALSEFKNSVYKTDYCFWQFLQFVFKKQWQKLKAYANEKGIKIIGDIPLYVAYDSSDVWARPDLFDLDEDLNPVHVAGVPPDYFSETGQLWGNPLYKWDALKEEGYEWWINRVKHASTLYDVIRIDHFRGLDRYFSIDAKAETAVDGKWLDGPKMQLFDAIKNKLGTLDFIAEDLGVLDDGVIELREETGFPGMKILLFAFGSGDDNAYLPQNTEENSVTYTGTHDNDTALGYLKTLTDKQFDAFKKQLRSALKYEGVIYPVVSREDAARALMLCALANKSKLAIVPIQDVLLLDNEARVNTPSVSSGNWQFRLLEMPSRKDSAILRKYIQKFNR
ncbi:MAG: 4-alpha-glucanotransferase [Clostridiales bacterium]|nr:4-alpha-glucanotransferase [Clostridiales bacterium]